MAVVLGATALSIAAGARAGSPRAADAVVRAMLWALVPFTTFVLLARLQLTAGIGVGIALGYVAAGATGFAAWAVGTRVLGLARPSVGALIVTSTLANTGYLGVPLAGALLGTAVLGPAVAWDQAINGPMFYVVAFAVGGAFGAGEPRPRRHLVTRNPPLLAALAGLATPAAVVPDALVSVAHVTVYALLVAGFFVLGSHLAGERSLRLTAPVAASVGLRVALAPAVVFALAAVLAVDVPHAYLLEAAMPSGINALIAAHAFGLDAGLAAAAIAWSTVVVVTAAALAAVLT